MMKRYLFFIMITTVLSFSANRLFAQNSLVLHLPDTVITLNSVDSVYYSHDANGVLMQHVVTIDSLYTFAVDEVDSMFYFGPEVTLNGVVRGGNPDSMLVMTLTDVLPVSDTNFTVTALRGDYRQLIVVTNLDTLPFMLYRGVLNPDETIVIDTMSTVMALLSWVMPFDSVLDSDYGQFCAIAEQCESFPTLYSLVAQSIAANRSLDDTLNDPMYEALGMVFAQIYQQITPPTPMMFSYEQGNNTMLVETSGSIVNLRMRNLNPSYFGTVKDKDGNVLKPFFAVRTRENYGLWSTAGFFVSQLFSQDASWSDFNMGEYSTIDMSSLHRDQIFFNLTCRSNQAKAEFGLKTFVLPLLSLAGLQVDMGSCLYNAVYDAFSSVVNGITDNLLTSGFSSLNTDQRKKMVGTIFDNVRQAGTGSLINSAEHSANPFSTASHCMDIKHMKLQNVLKTIGKMNKIVTAAEEILNSVTRCLAYANAPDDISFCMEWFNNVGEDAHYCTTPVVTCPSGNGQVGKPDSLLQNPIKLRVTAFDHIPVAHKRPMALHIKIKEGDGELEDTLFLVTTYSTIDPSVERTTRWRLGPDSLPQRAVAWLTPQDDFSTLLGDSLQLIAYTHRIDSFRVKINTYATFSKGNLQYQPSTNTWRFAEQQYDMIGMDNLNLTSGDHTYTDWIDLFSWGTGNDPTYVPNNNTYYNNGGGNVFYDWGRNPISNGDSVAGLWRTPEFAEWNYLMTGRPNADLLHTFATVVDVPGMILLPDNWQMPDSVDYIPNIHDYTVNVYDTASWAILEDAGAVFLPAAGFRCRTSTSLNSFTVTQVGNAGAYWSSWGYPYYAAGSYVEQRYAYRMAFFGSSGRVFPYQGVECYWGQSVRLIRTL